MFYFVFPHPQFFSLSYFPSSNIVTHLWQQLHIQLVTSDVIYHSEKERFTNAKMSLNVRKKAVFIVLCMAGLSFHNMQRLLDRHRLTVGVHCMYAA